MLPNCGYVRLFEVLKYKEGFILNLPRRKAPDVLEEFVPLEKVFDTMMTATRWGDMLGINTVGDLSNTNLPPVIDLEFYGDYSNSPLSRKETQEILNTLLQQLEAYYHVKPIIYTTTRAYYHYLLGGGYGDYPLWFRNMYQEPFVNWSFWQYSDEGILAGYDGIQSDCTEMYIDLNVYHSSYEAFLEEFSLPETTRETLANYEKEEKENKT